MIRIETIDDLADVDHLTTDLFAEARAADGRDPLSDQLRLDLEHGPRPGSAAAIARDHGGQVIGYAQTSAGNDSTVVQLVVAPAWRDDLVEVGEPLLRRVCSHVGAESVTWWVPEPERAHHDLAGRLGWSAGRSLLQMRRSLPIDATIDIEVRAFRPGEDDEDWIAVNNRAFHDHGEQGGWDLATLQQRLAEPWFDPSGFLVHERDGRIAGFCWTKVHDELDPPEGEIYVIAVDPDFHGAGLGRQLTLAGLDRLAARGIGIGMLFVDADNTAAVRLYEQLGFTVHRTDVAFTGAPPTDTLPRWSTAHVHESVEARSFTDAVEGARADVHRLTALFDQHGVRACANGAPSTPGEDHGRAADECIAALNATTRALQILQSVAYAAVSTDSRDDAAQAAMGELSVIEARLTPLVARLAEWVHSLGVDALATVSSEVTDHLGPLRRLDERAAHQMSEAEEGLYSDLTTTGSSAWNRLQRDVTSQLTADVEFPDGRVETLAMSAVRGLATHGDPDVRRAAYDAELRAWPTIATPVAAALNAVKGEAISVNRRRNWSSPLDASLFANSVSRATFDAMHSAVVAALPDFRRWMRTKATLHGHVTSTLPWWDLAAPLPHAADSLSWHDGLAVVRDGFATYGDDLAGLVDRALDERWIDAAPRPGKTGGAFCMPFVDDRSLVLLNWSDSLDAAQTTAHELGHAFHNTTLAHRTPLQRRLPMALAETASIFCETLVVEAGLDRLEGPERLALLDVDLQGANQLVVDIHSRLLFETELFERRERRTLSATELDEMMLDAQAQAYGDGIDQSTAHPHMWLLKPHYYSSHFYNWPYTYGLLFGLGLFSRFRDDPDRFRHGYADLLSRAGMDTAEELGAAFGIDVTDPAFWVASLDVLRVRIADYTELAERRLAAS